MEILFFATLINCSRQCDYLFDESVVPVELKQFKNLYTAKDSEYTILILNSDVELKGFLDVNKLNVKKPEKLDKKLSFNVVSANLDVDDDVYIDFDSLEYLNKCLKREINENDCNLVKYIFQNFYGTVFLKNKEKGKLTFLSIDKLNLLNTITLQNHQNIVSLENEMAEILQKHKFLEEDSNFNSKFRYSILLSKVDVEKLKFDCLTNLSDKPENLQCIKFPCEPGNEVNLEINGRKIKTMCPYSQISDKGPQKCKETDHFMKIEGEFNLIQKGLSNLDNIFKYEHVAIYSLLFGLSLGVMAILKLSFYKKLSLCMLLIAFTGLLQQFN